MQLWEMAIRFTLNLLIITIFLVGVVVKTFMDLRLLLSADLEVALRRIIVDTLTILAVVEVLKTSLDLLLRRPGSSNVYRGHGPGGQ